MLRIHETHRRMSFVGAQRAGTVKGGKGDRRHLSSTLRILERESVRDQGKTENDEQQVSVCGSHRRSPGMKEERNEIHEASGESRTAREEEGPSLAVRRRGRERVHVCSNERERERGLCHWYIKLSSSKQQCSHRKKPKTLISPDAQMTPGRRRVEGAAAVGDW